VSGSSGSGFGGGGRESKVEESCQIVIKLFWPEKCEGLGRGLVLGGTL
jgi:hypothetical protein